MDILAQLSLSFNDQGQADGGPIYCPEAGEYCRQLADGTFIWSESPEECDRLYFEAVRVQADHCRRCPSDSIPFDGSLPDYVETGGPRDLGLVTW